MSNKIPSFNDICGTITESLAETILNREATIAELRVQVSNLHKVIGGYEQKVDERMNIIRDYEKTIGDLREEVANLNGKLHGNTISIAEYRQDNDILRKQVTDLREEVSILKDECESLAADAVENNSAHDQFVRTHYNFLQKEHECEDLKNQIDALRAECEGLKKEIDGWREECEIHERDEKELYRLQEAIRPLKSENIRLTAQRDQFEADNKRLKTALTVTENSHRDIDAQCKNLLAENERLKKASSGCAADPVYSIRDTTPCLFDQSDSDPVTGVQYGDLH